MFDTHALVPTYPHNVNHRDTLTPKAGDEAILLLSMGHVEMVAGHIMSALADVLLADVLLADVLLAVGIVRLLAGLHGPIGSNTLTAGMTSNCSRMGRGTTT